MQAVHSDLEALASQEDSFWSQNFRQEASVHNSSLQLAEFCRGHIHPQPEHKYHKAKQTNNSLWAALLLPFRPVISAYGGLASMLERLRVGLVYIIPEINNDVTMALARVFPGSLSTTSQSIRG